jgi:hypothetical protein
MPTTIVGRGDEAELYLLHHDRLVRALARLLLVSARTGLTPCEQLARRAQHARLIRLLKRGLPRR